MGDNIWLLLFLSIALGLLVGLQREASNSQTAGIRTFPLITVFGTVCGLIAKEWGGWILGAGLIAIAAIMILGNLQRLRTSKDVGGITTEVAVLLMYVIG